MIIVQLQNPHLCFRVSQHTQIDGMHYLGGEDHAVILSHILVTKSPAINASANTKHKRQVTIAIVQYALLTHILRYM